MNRQGSSPEDPLLSHLCEQLVHFIEARQEMMDLYPYFGFGFDCSGLFFQGRKTIGQYGPHVQPDDQWCSQNLS